MGVRQFYYSVLLLMALLGIVLVQNHGSGSETPFQNDVNVASTTFEQSTLWLPVLYNDKGKVGWTMAGANPQRTSWVPEGVDPEATAEFGVEWYRPIEAYIGQHVQLIAARDKIYVSTAKGLYALDANNGDVVWRFDTEMPLGNSPSIDGNDLYVGGLDRRVYALNADTGSKIWTFDNAKGGFTTNPLVVEGRVLLGSRDGYFYAINRTDGTLLWQYPSLGQDPIGPILYSAAFKEGTVFFASNDNYAYALDVMSGKLIWKSEKMPGDGFQAWWPVVYGDFVVFSSALPYAEESEPGTRSLERVIDKTDPYYSLMNEFQNGTDFIKYIQRDDVFHQGEDSGSLLGPDFISGSSNDNSNIQWSWGNGKTVIDASKVTEYLEDDGQEIVNRPVNKPWRRGVIVLSAATGDEYSFDSDGDGLPEYAPFLFTGTKSGNRYPPLVIPTQNVIGDTVPVLYLQNFNSYKDGWDISRAGLFAWQFGTQYIHPVGGRYAIDEPFAQSAGGTILYENLCCDRVGGWSNLSTGSSRTLWSYSRTLESIKLDWDDIEPWMRSLAPGYDEMWWEASMWLGLPRLYGNYGTMNGIYHNHGVQNPIIPYKNQLFVHRSNAVIALGPNPVEIRQRDQNETPDQYEQNIQKEFPDVYRPLLRIEEPDQIQGSIVTVQDVQRFLDDQITRVLQTGHLRPGYFNSTASLPEFSNYYENPGDTLLTLVQAYPYVSCSFKPNLEKYIKQHYKRYFSNGMMARSGYWIEIPTPYNLDNPDGFGQLQPREWMPLPPEVNTDLSSFHAVASVEGYLWKYPQHNFYAMWLFAEEFYQGDQVKLVEIYDDAKSRLKTQLPDENDLTDKPWVHNGLIAGYIGFLNLQELADMSQQDSAIRSIVQTNLDTLLVLRANAFRKDSPWAAKDPCCKNYTGKQKFNVARNFLYLTPELAAYWQQNAYDTVEEAISEYASVAPYWMATRYEASFGEFSTDSLYTNHALFMAKSYIVKESTEQLLKYLDVPAFRIGDLFYILNLIAILDS